MDQIETLRKLLVQSNRNAFYLERELDKYKALTAFLGFMCIGLLGLVVVW